MCVSVFGPGFYLTFLTDSDPGAFLLARAGLYIREINTWAIHMFFDGTDIHTGIGATTAFTKSEFQKWVETDLDTAWKQSDMGRVGVVSYVMRSAQDRCRRTEFSSGRQTGGSVVQNMGSTGEAGSRRMGPEKARRRRIEISRKMENMPCGRRVRVRSEKDWGGR